MVDPRQYRSGTKEALALLSRGHCYFPGCKVPTFVFVDGEPIVNYHVAHIRDAKPGNRYVKEMTDDERRNFSNLVLLCMPHHTEVDKRNPTKYSIEVLEAWKADRETGGVAELRGLDGLTEDRLEEMIRSAVGGGLSRERPALRWSLEDEAFEDVLAATLQADDDIALRRFLQRCVSDWKTSVEASDGSTTSAEQILDRLICFAANAIRWDRLTWVEMALEAVENLFAVVLTEHGTARSDLVEPGHRLLMAIIDRILGLGTVAVDEKAWSLIPQLVMRKPLHLPSTYTNWVRFTTTLAERASEGQASTGASRAYLEHTIEATAKMPCLNPDAPVDEPFRTRIVSFDALATITAWHRAVDLGGYPYYPWHRAYEGSRYEHALVELINNDRLRSVVFPDTDAALAGLLLRLEEISRTEMGRYGGGGWRYTDPTVLAFVASESDRLLRAQLVESVTVHAKLIGKALPVKRAGRRPVVVSFTNGVTRFYMDDFESYSRLANEGLIDPRVTFVRKPPRLLSEWTSAELQAWLDDN